MAGRSDIDGGRPDRALTPDDRLHATLHDGPASPALPVLANRRGGRVMVQGRTDVDALPLRLLRRGAVIGTSVAVHRTDRGAWQLVVHDVPADAWPHRLAPRGATASRGRWIAGVVALLAALAAALWAFSGTLIAAAAPLLPHRVTEPIGRAYLAEIGATCTESSGRAALDRLTGRLTATTTLPEPMALDVVDVPDVNAVALPGGHVAIYRGLLDQAASPDEIGGELAHEIAHVVRQHPNQALLREMGPTVLARAVGSDAGKLASLTLLLHGSRAAEAEADGGAIATLHAARISPDGAAAFFDRQILLGGRGNYADEHPSEAARSARYHAAVVAGAAPAMSEGDWRALRAICA